MEIWDSEKSDSEKWDSETTELFMQLTSLPEYQNAVTGHRDWNKITNEIKKHFPSFDKTSGACLSKLRRENRQQHKQAAFALLMLAKNQSESSESSE